MIVAQEAHGEALAACFGLEQAPSLSTAGYKAAQMVATLIEAAPGQMADARPIPPENAYLLTVRLTDARGVTVTRAGVAGARTDFTGGTAGLFDLRDEVCKQTSEAYSAIHFYLPAILLPELVEDAAQLEFACDFARDDAYLRDLALSLLPFFGVESRAVTRFFDGVAALIARRIVSCWAHKREQAEEAPSALSRWQLRHAKEMLAASLVDRPDLEAIAAACDLSLERFLRGFRQTVGLPPYTWLRGHRAQRAREMVVSSREPLVAIAYACGFSDQSHMTRSFVREFGVSPGAMRKQKAGGEAMASRMCEAA